jgi:hypothetical protein
MAAEGAGPFDESGLLADARRKTDLEDFGDESFRTPLRVLLASLAEAPLNAVGTLVLRASIRRSFMRRLRAEYWIGRHPEIAEERIETPLVVVGMMRSGTTLVQRLLARDPQFYAVLGWEIGEPAPRPGTDWRSSDPRVAAGRASSEQMRKFAPELQCDPSHRRHGARRGDRLSRRRVSLPRPRGLVPRSRIPCLARRAGLHARLPLPAPDAPAPAVAEAATRGATRALGAQDARGDADSERCDLLGE